jgi:hypothetical protein
MEKYPMHAPIVYFRIRGALWRRRNGSVLAIVPMWVGFAVSQELTWAGGRPLTLPTVCFSETCERPGG